MTRLLRIAALVVLFLALPLIKRERSACAPPAPR